jgi:hypothetical protein
MSPFLATECAVGAENEMPCRESISCEGLPYGGIRTAVKDVVYS